MASIWRAVSTSKISSARMVDIAITSPIRDRTIGGVMMNARLKVSAFSQLPGKKFTGGTSSPAARAYTARLIPARPHGPHDVGHIHGQDALIGMLAQSISCQQSSRKADEVARQGASRCYTSSENPAIQLRSGKKVTKNHVASTPAADDVQPLRMLQRFEQGNPELEQAGERDPQQQKMQVLQCRDEVRLEIRGLQWNEQISPFDKSMNETKSRQPGEAARQVELRGMARLQGDRQAKHKERQPIYELDDDCVDRDEVSQEFHHSREL